MEPPKARRPLGSPRRRSPLVSPRRRPRGRRSPSRSSSRGHADTGAARTAAVLVCLFGESDDEHRVYSIPLPKLTQHQLHLLRAIRDFPSAYEPLECRCPGAGDGRTPDCDDPSQTKAIDVLARHWEHEMLPASVRLPPAADIVELYACKA